jgi:hypothetical protein
MKEGAIKMSRIYFHSSDDERIEVAGTERAYFGILCSKIMWMALSRLINPSGDNSSSLLRKVFPAGHYVVQEGDFKKRAELFFRVGHDHILFDGKPIEVLGLMLNTACYMGGTPIKLAARLHGQCELHTYVNGENREWLAKIIEGAVKKNIFNSEIGWENVVEMLKSGKTSPVVTSYSGCDRFPNMAVAEYSGRQKDWEKLSNEVQWELGMKGLRQLGGGRELNPETWDEFYFNDGLDANMLVRKLKERG